MTPMHLGPMHPIEQVLTLVLAFGPFLVLGAVVWWRRRVEDAEDAAAARAAGGEGAEAEADAPAEGRQAER
ncbi:hypothetical protein [Nocardioides litoris]|uniref:hypothetical protein n=1 Tax=Nocardioides litoris TaxID=1926648 RepID=UPI0014773E3F|nr:hypothetical protein [Nocardioides litoris]